MSKLHSACPVEPTGERFLRKSCNFTCFLFVRFYCLRHVVKNFGSVVKNGIYKSCDINWRWKVLRKTWKYLIIILLEQLNLGLSGQKLSAGPPKLVFTGHLGELEKFYGTFCLFLTFCDFQSEYLGLLWKEFSSIRSKMNSTWRQDWATLRWKSFGSVAKLVFHLSSGSSWGCFFRMDCTFTTFFRLWGFCFWHFVEKFSQHCPNCHLLVLRNKLKKKNASKELKHFDHHLTWRMKSWAFLSKISSRAAKIRFCGSSRTIWKTCFETICNLQLFLSFSRFLGLSAQIFWQICQKWILGVRRIVRRPIKNFRQRCRNCVLSVQCNFSLDAFFERTQFSPLFSTVSSLFSTFRQKTPAALSKLAATCPQKTLWGKGNAQKYLNFSIIVVLGRLNLGLSDETFSARLPKLPFAVEIEQFGNFFFQKIVAIFHHFLTLIKNLLLLREKFLQVCQNRSFSVRRIFRRSCDIFLKVLSEMHSTCPVELSRGLFWKNCNSTKILDFEHFFSAFRQKIPAALSKLPSTCPEKHFEGKKWFERPEFFRSSSNWENETLRFLVENFQQACRNWVLQVKWKFLRIFFWNKLHFLSFFDFHFLFL